MTITEDIKKGYSIFEHSSANSRLMRLNEITVYPVLSSHSQKDQKLVFKANYLLMQVKSIAECSKRSILQYL